MLFFLNTIIVKTAGHLIWVLRVLWEFITDRFWLLANKTNKWQWIFTRRYPFCMITLLALLIAGCGFKLRGEADLPPELAKTYINSNRPPGAPPSSLGRTLNDLLVANGVEVTKTPQGATAIIELLDERIRRRIVASDSIGDTREYTFTLEVDYRVAMPNGRPLLAMDTIRLSRDIIYAESEVLGRQEGEAITLREMESSAAQAIVRRLETINRFNEAAL
jgi:LPS-assembly lipoprotein